MASPPQMRPEKRFCDRYKPGEHVTVYNSFQAIAHEFRNLNATEMRKQSAQDRKEQLVVDLVLDHPSFATIFGDWSQEDKLDLAMHNSHLQQAWKAARTRQNTLSKQSTATTEEPLESVDSEEDGKRPFDFNDVTSGGLPSIPPVEQNSEQEDHGILDDTSSVTEGRSQATADNEDKTYHSASIALNAEDSFTQTPSTPSTDKPIKCNVHLIPSPAQQNQTPQHLVLPLTELCTSQTTPLTTLSFHQIQTALQKAGHQINLPEIRFFHPGNTSTPAQIIRNPDHLGRLWTSDSDAGERLQLMVMPCAIARKLDRRYKLRYSRGVRRTAAKRREASGYQHDNDSHHQLQSDATATDTMNERVGTSMVANETQGEEFFDAQEQIGPSVWNAMTKNICGFFWRP